MDDHLCATKKEKILKILLNTERGKLGNVVPFSLTLPVHWGHWVQGRDSIRTTAALHAVHHSSSKLQDHKKTKLYQHFGFNCAGTAHPAFLIRAHDGVGQKEVQWAPNETEESSGHSVCVSFLNFLTSPQQHLWNYVSHFSSYTASFFLIHCLLYHCTQPGSSLGRTKTVRSCRLKNSIQYRVQRYQIQTDLQFIFCRLHWF